MKTARTIDDLVSMLGGRTQIAKEFGIVPGNISNWISEQSIPCGWHLRLLLLAAGSGVEVSPAVFEMTDREFDVLHLGKKNGHPGGGEITAA